MFGSGTEYEIFRYNNCERCKFHLERESDGFPAFPEDGGCAIEDLLERARFNTDLFPEKHIANGKCDKFERMLVEHELKILPEYYKAVIKRNKTFELRKDDRDYRVGDRLWLREWDGEKYTGRQTKNREITYILRNAKKYGLADGYCILGIQPVDWGEVVLDQSEVQNDK